MIAELIIFQLWQVTIAKDDGCARFLVVRAIVEECEIYIRFVKMRIVRHFKMIAMNADEITARDDLLVILVKSPTFQLYSGTFHYIDTYHSIV